jgi:hypothetical protein
MITTSPERRRMGMGSVSRLVPPSKKMAALPMLWGSVISEKGKTKRELYDIETKGVLAQISDRST